MPRKYNRVDRSHHIRELLELAQSGAARPLQKTPLGRYLSAMTCSGSKSYYDEETDAKLRALRPDWFKKSKHAATPNKLLLLDMAQSGKARPNGMMGNNLHHYTHPASGSYDEAFAKQIMEIAPLWFSAGREKAQMDALVDAAKQGGEIPDTHFLRSVTRPSQSRYSPQLSRWLRETRPEWFGPQEIYKSRLLEMARAKDHRPSVVRHGRNIYYAFRRYTVATDPSYDPVFTEKLFELAPRWR